MIQDRRAGGQCLQQGDDQLLRVLPGEGQPAGLCLHAGMVGQGEVQRGGGGQGRGRGQRAHGRALGVELLPQDGQLLARGGGEQSQGEVAAHVHRGGRTRDHDGDVIHILQLAEGGGDGLRGGVELLGGEDQRAGSQVHRAHAAGEHHRVVARQGQGGRAADGGDPAVALVAQQRGEDVLRRVLPIGEGQLVIEGQEGLPVPAGEVEGHRSGVAQRRIAVGGGGGNCRGQRRGEVSLLRGGAGKQQARAEQDAQAKAQLLHLDAPPSVSWLRPTRHKPRS